MRLSIPAFSIFLHVFSCLVSLVQSFFVAKSSVHVPLARLRSVFSLRSQRDQIIASPTAHLEYDHEYEVRPDRNVTLGAVS